MWRLGKGWRDTPGYSKQRGGTVMFSKMTVTFLTQKLYAKHCFPLPLIFWGMALAEGFQKPGASETRKSFTIPSTVFVPVKLSHFYTVYCRCAANFMATHLSCNKLSNSRNTSWGTLEKFRHTRVLWYTGEDFEPPSILHCTNARSQVNYNTIQMLVCITTSINSKPPRETNPKHTFSAELGNSADNIVQRE